MKFKLVFIAIITIAINMQADNLPCGSVINDTFDEAGALPSGWVEYNTSGRVTVENGHMKFNYNATKPSAYRTFDPVSKNTSFSFDVQGSRNTVNCQMDIVSSDGKYIASIALGKATSDIKYATSMAAEIPAEYIAGVIEGKFAKNTNYSLSLNIDFTNKTINFYNAGVLTLENIPFLEAASDISKIDISLIYMYGNSGTFFFDNITLVDPNEARQALNTALTSSQVAISGAVVGTGFQQYPQEAVDKYQGVIERINTVLGDCDALDETITAALTELQAAEADFMAAQHNPIVIKLYSAYNFTGEEAEFNCGYYNGTIGDFEDKTVSFKLDAGYMATFAQDVNGLGASKVYVAQDNALEINLPEELQRSVSFMRVSPWYPVRKKGSLGDVKWSTSDNYNTSWYYNWGLTASVTESPQSNVQFVPMSWSAGNDRTSLEKMATIGQDMTLNHHMAFNEPDNAGQSNMTVAQALAAYPKLLASGLRLGAPGVENVQYSANNDSFNDDAWIQEFMDSCVARGYRVDFIAAHDYVRRTKSTFLERFKALHDRYNLPVWVTEYNYGNPNMGSANLTVEKGYTNIKSLTEALEGADFIERYNWYYFFGATSGIGGITNGELNITGQFYRDLESKASYVQEEYEQGPDTETGVAASFEVEKQAFVYPNPSVSNVININYIDASLKSDAWVNIYDINGKVVLSQSNSPKSINISHLQDGFYIVKIKSVALEISQKILINR